MWTNSPEERAKRGHALINLEVVGQVNEVFHTFVHTFQTHKLDNGIHFKLWFINLIK